MKTLLERINPKKAALIFGAIIALLVMNRIISNFEKEEVVVPEEKTKTVEVITFGEWSPDSQREITGTILSGSDIDVQAEVSGTIEEVWVSIGDKVTKGQPLASFERQNDATQISYENLLQQFAVTKIQTAATVQSAETTLLTAQRQQEQTESTEAQNYSRTFDLLDTSARNAETTFRNTVEWADQLLGVSTGSRGDAGYTSQQIGRNNTKVRQDTKNQIEDIIRDRIRVDREILPQSMSDADVLRLANDRLDLLTNAQAIVRSIDSLVRSTPVTSSFTATNKATYRTESDTYLAAIDAAVYALETQVEAAKSEQGRNRLSVLGVDNAAQQASAALQVARAQAQAQITTLETQIRLARSSQSDLVVRAPFDGAITGKNVLPYDRVMAGTALFSMVGEDLDPKMSATITRDELMRVQANIDKVTAKLEDGRIIALPEIEISGKLNSLTQKVSVDFPIEEMPEGALVGSFVKILLPIDGTVSNLLPISAISFEPDGAEVLVFDDGMGSRNKVEIGKIVSNAVEVIGGLENGAEIIRYRNRAHAGEKLEIQK